MMSPHCLEYQGCQFDPTFPYLLFCSSSLLVFLSYRFLLLAHSPHFFFTKLHFPKGRLLCGSLFKLVWGERLGDEYFFSWWYVQHMLSYVTGISLYTLRSIFNFATVFVHSPISFYLICYCNSRPKWYQHLQLLTLFAIFYESNTEGTNFWTMFICFTFVKSACFVLYSTCVRFDLVKSPEVILCAAVDWVISQQ